MKADERLLRFWWDSDAEQVFKNSSIGSEEELKLSDTVCIVSEKSFIDDTKEDMNAFHLEGAMEVYILSGEKVNSTYKMDAYWWSTENENHSLHREDGAILRRTSDGVWTLSGNFSLQGLDGVEGAAEAKLLQFPGVQSNHEDLSRLFDLGVLQSNREETAGQQSEYDGQLEWSQTSEQTWQASEPAVYGIFPSDGIRLTVTAAEGTQLTPVYDNATLTLENAVLGVAVTEEEAEATAVSVTIERNTVTNEGSNGGNGVINGAAGGTNTETGKTDTSTGSQGQTAPVESTGFPSWLAQHEPIPTLTLGGAFLAACVVAAVLAAKLRKVRNKRGKELEKPVNSQVEASPVTDPGLARRGPAGPMAPRVYQVQGIGRRQYQQDTMGFLLLHGGAFAVVADGMGGLADGDKVSQKIVQTMLADASGHTVQEVGDNLMQMLSHANTEVNQMLGPSDQYKSGSTLLAVAAGPESFQWISVGDSRIYLYRGGAMLQINHEHVYKAELLNLAVNRILNFSDALGNPQGKNVTSFVGMGNLKYIDLSLNPVLLAPGDRICLMSDGVFNALNERNMAEIFAMYPDGNQAVAAIDASVQQRADPYQDNYSLVLIDY